MNVMLKGELTTMTVNVLGTDYVMKIGNRKDLDIADGQCGTCCSYGEKLIKIVTDEFKDDEDANVKLIQEVIMHELAHAFLYESGLVTYSDDEVLVNWLSVNTRKLMNLALQVQDDLEILD